MVAWALSEFCDKDEESQTEVAVAGGIRLLVYLLAHDTIEDSQKTKSSVHAVVTTTMGHPKGGENHRMIVKPNDPDNSFLPGRTHSSPADHRTVGDLWTGPGDAGRTHSFPASLRTISKSSRDSEDPETKIRLKSEAARALWKVAKNNVKNSKSITDTRALLCFAKLIETGKGDLQYNCIMAAVVIAAAAEKDAELRRAAFKTVAPAAKAIVDQLLRVIQTGEPELQVMCLPSSVSSQKPMVFTSVFSSVGLVSPFFDTTWVHITRNLFWGIPVRYEYLGMFWYLMPFGSMYHARIFMSRETTLVSIQFNDGMDPLFDLGIYKESLIL